VTKTTVYLTSDLKRSLAAEAARSGRSEAELIREAISAAAAGWGRPRPRGGLYRSGDPSLSEHVDDALSGFGSDHGHE
jgi:hypothetical protein